MAQPLHMTKLAGAIALATLAGCAMDTEAEVRDQVDAWVDIGETLHFDSGFGCTGGVFRMASGQVKSTAPHAVSIREGLSLLSQVGTASFQMDGLSPSDISGQINSMDISVGTGVLAAGLGARDCLEGPWKAAYKSALQTRGAVLIYSLKHKALVVIDRAAQRVYFSRGDV
jgi:hypothetical protein